VTSREEEAHATLKRSLMSFTDDLKIVIDNLDLLMINQRHEYVQKSKRSRYDIQ
jgi:hypothetical protein